MPNSLPIAIVYMRVLAAGRRELLLLQAAADRLLDIQGWALG
jgi:hypothetical protein